MKPINQINHKSEVKNQKILLPTYMENFFFLPKFSIARNDKKKPSF